MRKINNDFQWQCSTGLTGQVIALRQVIVSVVDQPETVTLTQGQQAILIVEP